MFILILSKALNLNYRSLRRGGNLYRDILGYLRELAYLEEQRGFHNSHIALYHAGMASKDQDYILHEFSKPESVIRLVTSHMYFSLWLGDQYSRHWSCYSLGSRWLYYGLLAGGWKGGTGWKESKSPLLCDAWFTAASLWWNEGAMQKGG